MLENIHEAKLLQPIGAFRWVTWQWRDSDVFIYLFASCAV